ncbi:LysR family transcriptional regulator [Actinoplanes sp. NPDC051851]|uniref:LysR family transcriptional regulator n=1 Tax=Actinoplanes sp. NPDC051851 TaxID=3154753 RepID=UPI00344682CE
MNLGTVDLNLLVALRALLEEENVTHAGARVGMGQPAMSAALGRLRRHFDDELLVRVGREYELTPFARSMIPAVQEAVQLLGDALRVTEGFDPASSERIFTVTLSDYAMSVLHEPLRRRVKAAAPRVRLAFTDMADDLSGSERALLRQDLLVGPPGYGFAGEHLRLFRDRYVCVVDRGNTYVENGLLSVSALRDMPHAVTVFRGHHQTPVDRVLGQTGVDRHISMRVYGHLPLLFAVRRTDAVAFVPERIARAFTGDGKLLLVEPPFAAPVLLEAAWWHPSRDADPAHRWFLSVLREVAAELRSSEPAGLPPSPAA